MMSNHLLLGILMFLAFVGLMVVSLLLKNWLWARKWGFRKGDEIKIESSSNYDGEYTVTKVRGDDIEVEKKE